MKKEHIEAILQETERAGIKDLLAWMDANGFYTAPCSTRYHLSTPGGLAKHSFNVYQIALDIANFLLDSDAYEEIYNSIIICSLLHDLGKCGQFGKPAYIIDDTFADEDSFDDPDPVFKGNKELLFVPHEVRSVAIASRFIELTEEEQFAIIYHNGMYGELKGFKGKETPLQMILHFADLWASRVIEKE